MNPTSQSSAPPEPPPPPAAFSVDDVWFTLFRHKWIVLVCAVLGVVSAAAVYKFTPVIYSSKTKLIVRYVVEDESSDQTGSQNVRVNNADQAAMNTEVEILTSMDVAKDVATSIGPERILAKKGGGNNALMAAAVIKNGITVLPSPRANVLFVFFEHPDREIVQPVLDELIQTYLAAHLEMHTPDDKIGSGQEAELKVGLLEAEKQLDQKMRNAGVVDIEAMKKVYNLQLEKLNTDLLVARTEMAEHESVIKQMAPAVLDSAQTNTPAKNESAVPPDKLEDYSLVLGRLSDLNKREREFRMQGFTDAHPSITSLRNQREELLTNKMELEHDYPALVTSTSSYVGTSATAGAGGIDIQAEVAKMLVLKARVRALGEEITNIMGNAFALQDVAPEIVELQRQRDELKKKLDFISQRRDSERSDSLSAKNLANIKVAETPTPPIVNNEKRKKGTAAAFGGFLGLGLVIAFLIDFVIDRTVRRSADVKRRLKLPVLLAIEDTNWVNGGPRHRSNGDSKDASGANGIVGHHIAPWEDGHHLHFINEGLRERLVTYFEIHDMVHKPKLVALTACDKGSGVSTLAGGLAAALSKTGEGSVLLVDMHTGNGGVKTFYKGKLGGPEPEPLKDDTDMETSGTLVPMPKDAKGPRPKILPNYFTNLVPVSDAKNYDYIVFDMPPVSATSATPRLASHMDVVLLVLESEKTGLQSATRASALLTEARTNTVAILNKCRRYVPERLTQEL